MLNVAAINFKTSTWFVWSFIQFILHWSWVHKLWPKLYVPSLEKETKDKVDSNYSFNNAFEQNYILIYQTNTCPCAHNKPTLVCLKGYTKFYKILL